MPSQRITIVPATIDHVYALARNLRAADAAESESVGVAPAKAIRLSYKTSIIRDTIFVDGELAAMFGMGGTFGGTGEPWLMTAAPVERVPKSLVYVGRYQVTRMLRICPRLENHVAASYTGALRLVAILGFTVDQPKPIGKKGALFCRIRMGGPAWASH